MAWEVEVSDTFEAWFDALDDQERRSVATTIDLLVEEGPSLPFPHSSKVTQSRYGTMRELRIQHQGRPYRVLYAFDPRRTAFVILGGDKTGNDRWYDQNVPKADREFEEHLRTLKQEGLIDG